VMGADVSAVPIGRLLCQDALQTLAPRQSLLVNPL
jgi:hypothetical protein